MLTIPTVSTIHIPSRPSCLFWELNAAFPISEFDETVFRSFACELRVCLRKVIVFSHFGPHVVPVLDQENAAFGLQRDTATPGVPFQFQLAYLDGLFGNLARPAAKLGLKNQTLPFQG